MTVRRIEREILFEYATELFKNSSFVFFTRFNGITVKDMTVIRNDIRNINARCIIFKNSYIKLALEENAIELPADFKLTGDTMCIIGDADPSLVAKEIKEKNKDHESFECKLAVIEGKLVSAETVKALAEMPPKEVLLSQLLSIMKQPAQRLVRTLSTRRSSIVWLLENYLNKLEENK